MKNKPMMLMSKENPYGWKLEELLGKLIEEVKEKSEKIIDSPHPQRDMILRHNYEIIEHLLTAKAFQEETYRQLDAATLTMELITLDYV